MTSTTGYAAHCFYKTGNCQLHQGEHLHWLVNQTALCQFLPYKNIQGTLWGKNWLSLDQNLAVTFNNPVQHKSCNKRELIIETDQGLLVQFIDNIITNGSEDQIYSQNVYQLPGYSI